MLDNHTVSLGSWTNRQKQYSLASLFHLVIGINICSTQCSISGDSIHPLILPSKGRLLCILTKLYQDMM